MSFLFQDALVGLERLSAVKLDKKSRFIRKNLADAEWKMGLCLLAMVRTGRFRELGFATISEYGERVLNLSGKKLSWLLNTAKALEHLPLLSQAFRGGEIGWGKVRVLQSLATPETEREWLDFALENTTDALNNKVSMSPAQWKRHRALEASLREEPIASVEAVKGVLRETYGCESPKRRGVEGKVGVSKGSSTESAPSTAAIGSETVVSGPEELGGVVSEADDASVRAESVPAEHQPARIRLVIELTPDQYALYETAERRVRAQAGKRVSRGDVFTRMAERVLDEGTARSRLRHQVLIHTCDQCRGAWYETDRGILPVQREVLKDALLRSKSSEAGSLVSGSESESWSKSPGVENAELDCVVGGDSATAVDEAEALSGANVSESESASKCKAETSTSKRARPIGNGPAGRKAHTSSGKSLGRSRKGRPGNPPRDFTEKALSVSREYIPTATLRALFARAGHCCERCRARSAHLEVHHVVPVSEGGGHALELLRLYCRACHSLHHQRDFQEKPTWSRAKAVAVSRGAVVLHEAAEVSGVP